MSFGATVDLTLRPSIRLLRATSALHVLVLAALPLTLPPGWPMAALAAAVAASWASLRRHPALGFGPRALQRLTWHAEGGWTVHDHAGSYKAMLLQDSSRHPVLLVLRYRLEGGGVRTRLLAGDEAEANGFRRLRARLAMASTDAVGESSQTRPG